MFVLEEIQADFELFLKKAFLADSSQDLIAIKVPIQIATYALDSRLKSKISPVDLCVQMAMQSLGSKKYSFDPDLILRYKKRKEEVLRALHSTTTPVSDPGFQSFSFLEAASIVEAILRARSVSEFSKIESKSRAAFGFDIKFGPPESDIQIRLVLSGHMDGAPSIKDEVTIVKRRREVAHLSISKTFGIGYWVPCEKNSKAPPDKLHDAFREPIFLVQMLCCSLNRHCQ